jgi:hypothetical protein
MVNVLRSKIRRTNNSRQDNYFSTFLLFSKQPLLGQGALLLKACAAYAWCVRIDRSDKEPQKFSGLHEERVVTTRRKSIVKIPSPEF